MENKASDKETMNIFDMVLTTTKASEIYPVADSTLRAWIKEGQFRESDIEKSGKTWLIRKDALEELLKSKNMYGKTFVLDGQEVFVEYLAYKNKTLQIWYEDSTVKTILDKMPYNELIPQIFEGFKEETKMKYRFVIIDNNKEEGDNWFFKKEKVWAFTLKGLVETIHKSMKAKGFDTSELETYCKQIGISL